MTPIALVQIGDVHFPDIESTTSAIDQKDQAVAPQLVDAIRPDRFRNSVKELLGVLEKRRDVGGLLICGDLTSRGKLDGYQSCVRYLNDILQLSNADRWIASQLHAVPGNHDIDRSACDPAGTSLLEKFKSLEKTWLDNSVPILCTKEARHTEHSSGSHKVSLFSMNSCLGCGEKRSLPALIREELATLLKPHINAATPESFELIGESLDTPAFTEDHVTDLVGAIRSLAVETIPVVLAHHNLLPQALLRVELYTEVINGGLVRSRLTECDRPILYCHGHIHSDPICVISDPVYVSGRLVCISAPQLRDGFNIIELHFSRSHVPIGCKVLQYRTSAEHGGVTLQSTVRVPLRSSRHALSLDDDLTRATSDCLTKEFVTFEQLRNSVAVSLNKDRQPAAPLVQAIEDLFWLGIADVHDHDEDSRVWRIRRLQP